MKFTVNAADFRSAWTIVSAAVPGRPSHPIMGGVRVMTVGQSLSLQGFDLSMGIETSCPATIEETGMAVFPARVGLFLAAIDGGEIHCEATEDRIVLSRGSLRFECPTLGKPEDFPAVFQVQGDKIPLSAEDFSVLTTAIGACQSCASSDEHKQVLTGVHISPDGGVFGTNGHILSVRETGFSLGGCTIAAKQCAVISKLKGSAVVQVDPSGLISITTSTQTVVCRLLDGTYPSVRSLIPPREDHLVFRVGDFKSLLSRVAIDAEIVKLSFSDGQLTATCKNDGTEAQDSIPTGWAGEDLSIRFNVKYLRLGLSLMEPEASFQFNGPTGLALIRSGGQLFGLMPIQVRE